MIVLAEFWVCCDGTGNHRPGSAGNDGGCRHGGDSTADGFASERSYAAADPAGLATARWTHRHSSAGTGHGARARWAIACSARRTAWSAAGTAGLV